MDQSQILDHAFYLAIALLIILGILMRTDRAFTLEKRELERENLSLRNQIAKFDRDGDGRIGGSRKGARQ